MKFLKLALVFVFLAKIASAQVINSFDSLGGPNYGVTGNWGDPGSMVFSGGILTVGGTATADNKFEFANIQSGVLNMTSATTLYFTATKNAGNLSTNFTVLFADSFGDYVFSATIVTSGWVTGVENSGSVALLNLGSGVASSIAYFTVSGDSSANAFRMSLNSLSLTPSAIPEPSTYVAIFGAAALGFVVVRRRFASK